MILLYIQILKCVRADLNTKGRVDILSGPHNFKGLFVGLELGLGEEVRLVVMGRVQVRSWVMHCVFESPHKDRRTRMWCMRREKWHVISG